MWSIIPILMEILFIVCMSDEDLEDLSNEECFRLVATGVCYTHDFQCDDNAKVAITDVYHTDNDECNSQGDCPNFSNITEKLPLTKPGKQQLDPVDDACTAKQRCLSRAQIGPQNQNFSVIKYHCIKGSQPVTVTCGDDPSRSSTEYSSSNGPQTTEMTSKTSSEMTEAGSDGAVAGGVTAAILIVAAVVILLLWFRYKRNRTSKSNPPSGVKTDENYSRASPFPDHNYLEIEAPKKQSLNNYDYATAAGGLVNTGQENKPQSEDDYDRIGDQPSGNGESKTDKSPGYDTTASAAESLQKFRNKKIPNQDNYYGYNHLGVNQQSKVLPDDYDTTASAVKVVAQLEAKDQVEDDYDHFHQQKGGTTATDSPYDIAEHNDQPTGDYSMASALHKQDPYDLAK